MVNRILLLIKNRQHRQVLEAGLAKKLYEIVPEEEQNLKTDFDLAIIDGPTLKRLNEEVLTTRSEVEPVFLPFLLLAVRRKGSIPVRSLGQLVDDVVVKPVNRNELRARVANLLRRRELSLTLKKEHDRVVRLSVTDDVSGFHNTRYLHRYLEKFFDSPKISERKLALVFFDLDNFKRVVDDHGHLIGSKVLREVAQVVSRVLDPDDRIVRYGGDEYVVVLPGQDRKMAMTKAERMRSIICSTPFLPKENLAIHVAASFGVASYPGDAQNEKELLNVADACLFESKRQGKNRIRQAGYL